MKNSKAIIGTEINTNVPDKEERKQLRKKRVERKQNGQQFGGDNNIQSSDIGSVVNGKSQVVNSVHHLDKRKVVGLKEITQVRIKSDESEAIRRLRDDELRRERLGKLQQEGLSSAKANAAIDMKWAELLEKEIPQELHHDIQMQMTTCSSVIRSKDEIIAEFQRQLRAKDEEYVRSLRVQADDIEGLVTRIRREFSELREEYEKEMAAITQAYEDERLQFISDHASDMENMFELRRQKELNYKEARQKREDQYQRDIDDLTVKGASQYNKLKIELELNIQTLKQQLEEIRATYQLNTEKLDYNYRVLTELDVEKNTELASYKRRLTKLKEQLNQFVSKYTELESSDNKTNSDLTNDYRSLTRKYKDLQSKFRHFELADTTKYDEMWAMHEDEAKDMVDKLLKADKIISEQILGWQWRAPDMNALQHILGKHGNIGQVTVDTNENNDITKTSTMVGFFDDADEEAKRLAAARIKATLRLLASEAGFLVNQDVQQSIADLPNDAAILSKAETMLKTLGVKSEETLNKLVTYFFRTPGDGCVTTEGDGVDDAELLLHHAGESVEYLKNMIRAEDVITAIRSYMEDCAADAGPVSGGIAGGAKAKEEEERIKQKRLQSLQNYWNQLSQVVSDDTIGVWKQLENYAVNLRDILVKRSTSIAEVDHLSKRNADLKRLLNEYLGNADLNNALQIPPAQVMRVRNNGSSNNVPFKNTMQN